MHLRPFPVAFTLAPLSGRAGLTSHEALEGQGDMQTWKTHKQQLSEPDAWQVDSKVDTRALCDSGSGILSRLQRQGHYDIRLSGSSGRGVARLTGCEGAVSPKVVGQGRYQAESPEALLEEQLSWRLSVSHLLWWVCDLPVPDSKSRLTLDADSRLACLEQDGWQIEYAHCVEQSGYWLPKHLKLYGQDFDVTLVIKDWQPRQLGR